MAVFVGAIICVWRQTSCCASSLGWQLRRNICLFSKWKPTSNFIPALILSIKQTPFVFYHFLHNTCLQNLWCVKSLSRFPCHPVFVYSIALGFVAVLPIAIYPLMKRITYWPQAFLGEAFSIFPVDDMQQISRNCSQLLKSTCATFYFVKLVAVLELCNYIEIWK